jgi:asparaginyl-tRNA synthetase
MILPNLYTSLSMKIVNVLNHDDTDMIKKGHLIISGWVRQYRKQTDMCFMNINDGSCPEGLQIVCNKSDNEELFNELETVNVGCYFKCRGSIIDSPAKGQRYELVLEQILTISSCPPQEYPLAKNVKLPTLRKIPYLRCRTKTFGSVFRIRNTVMYETHNFWQNASFLHLDPNVITANECEGGAGVFTVSEMMDKERNKIPTYKNKEIINYEKDHFKKQAFLTVSSQLQLEGMSCGMGNCYTTNKSFRSEHSLTNKHMSEFTHLEIEMIECSNEDLMRIGELYIRHIINKVYEKNYTDLVELNKFVSKGLLERFDALKELQFNRVTYDECIQVIQNNSDIQCSYGEDLSSEMENFLTTHYKGAVFVYNWPLSIKSFYMKHKTEECDNDSVQLCENFDLLMPYGVGELIGGSMREHREELLLKTMEEKGVPQNGLEWYIQLRRFGTVEHGGFGLGLDRLIMMVTGMINIKDVVPYPVYYQSCEC